jgi:hypothetical protein
MVDSAKIHALAVALEKRRHAPPNIGYYLQHNWKRHVLFILLYGLLIAAIVALGYYVPAILLAGFVVGRQTRDLQWYRSLAREWPSTSHFIDWQKVEAIAKSPVP